MLSQQSTYQKRSWQNTEISSSHPPALPPPNHILYNPFRHGPTLLAVAGYKLVLLPLQCCLLPSHLALFLSHVVSAAVIWFLSLLFFIKAEASHLHPSFMENDVGLLGLPHFTLLGWAHGPFKVFPLLPFIDSCWVGLLGIFPPSFLVEPIQGPFLFLEEGHLPMTESFTLPIGQCFLFLVLYRYFFSL